MAAAPLRFLSAAAWPLTIWSSLTQFGSHPADDYVERTFPIVATAVAFWACVAALLYFALTSAGGAGIFVAGGDDGETARLVRRGGMQFLDVLWFFTPVLYVIGFWLFTAREERFRG